MIDTARGPGLVRVVTKLFSALGVLNAGSAETAAAKPADRDGAGTGITDSSLNVTRVGGVATFITATVLGLLGTFNAADEKRVAVLVAIYAVIGVIVAAALIAIAMMISADIGARKDLAVGGKSDAVADFADLDTTTTQLTAPSHLLRVHAPHRDGKLTLPNGGGFPLRAMTIIRADASNNTHRLEIEGLDDAVATKQMQPGDRVDLYSDEEGKWHLV